MDACIITFLTKMASVVELRNATDAEITFVLDRWSLTQMSYLWTELWLEMRPSQKEFLGTSGELFTVRPSHVQTLWDIYITWISDWIQIATSHEFYAPLAFGPKRLMCTARQTSDLHIYICGEGICAEYIYIYAEYIYTYITANGYVARTCGFTYVHRGNPQLRALRGKSSGHLCRFSSRDQ